MNMLRHNHISNDELVAPAHLLQYDKKQIAARRRAE